MVTAHRICRVSELPPGARKLVEPAGKAIGVFNASENFYTLRNVCPHQCAPLCEGKIMGYVPPSAVGEYRWAAPSAIIRCPWRGWELEIKTGRSIFNPHRVRTQSLPVTMEYGVAITETAKPIMETYPVETGDGWVVVHV